MVRILSISYIFSFMSILEAPSVISSNHVPCSAVREIGKARPTRRTCCAEARVGCGGPPARP